VAAMAWWAHMLPMLTMDPPRPASTMPRATVWAGRHCSHASNRSHPPSRPAGLPASGAPASDCDSRPDERDRYQ
jgi:hypothetical protein